MSDDFSWRAGGEAGAGSTWDFEGEEGILIGELAGLSGIGTGYTTLWLKEAFNLNYEAASLDFYFDLDSNVSSEVILVA